MKNLRINTSLKKGIFNLLIIAFGLLVMSFITINPSITNYQVLSGSILIEGTGNLNHLKFKVDTPTFAGNFVKEGDELEDVKNLFFSFPINLPLTENKQNEEIVKALFKDKNCSEITFVQKRIMILPIMKMIHVVGEIKIGNQVHCIPLQMQYSTNEDGSITLNGKQLVNLSEFGINLPTTNATDQEITLNITLKLAKKQEAFAKLKVN